MTVLMLSTLIQILMFCLGSILIIQAGKQDKKTRNPYLLIPALMLIGLSAGLTTFLIVSLACLIIFVLPSKTNKLIGKADLLLFASILVIIILNQSIILTLMLYISLALTIILMLIDKKLKKEVPLIHYFSQGYSLMILLMIGLVIAITIWGMI